MHCIRTIAVNSHLQMQMVARHPPGVTHIADDLPGLYLLAGGDADRRAVGIQRFQPAAVVDLDVVYIKKADLLFTSNKSALAAFSIF